MTAEEYLSRMRDIERRMADLRKEKEAVKQEYVDSLPFKVDDYVCIDTGYSQEEAWIAGIGAVDWNAERVNLKINGHRKDGFRSGAARCCHVKIKDVEVLNENKKRYDVK
jgi:hypothetical protein